MTTTAVSTTIAQVEVSTNQTAMTVDALAKDWLNFVDVSANTLNTYNHALKNFTRWLEENHVSTISRDVVVSYRDSLLTKKLSVTTCRLYVACLRLFIKFLASKGICNDFTAHFKGVKVSSDVHSRDALTVDEAKDVFHSMAGTDTKSLRDKAIIGLMLATGLRCCEICRLDVGDIEKRGKKLYLKVFGKARQGKQDSVLLPAQCASLIAEYLKTRGKVQVDSPLFVSTSNRCAGQRLQPQTISRLAKKVLVNAGYNSARLTAHSLRHSFASVAITAGVDLRQVSKALRHKSVVVTEVYLHDLDAASNTATSTVANLIF